MSMNERFPRPVRWVVLPVLLIITGAVFFIPLLWVLSSSLRPANDIFRYLSPLGLKSLIPTDVTLENFINIFQGVFWRAAVNSIVVSAVTVVLGLIVCVLAAYALSALDFRGKNAVFACIVVGFLIPFDAVALPLGEMFNAWGLRNTYTALILPGIGNGLAIFALRQFFLGIPKDMREAAQLDGARTWSIIWRIYVPMSKPALISSSLILFVFQWQAYLWPLIVISRDEMQMAPVVLAKLQGQAEYGFDPGQIFAGTVVLAIIPMILLMKFQRHFVQSNSPGLDK